MNILPKKRWHVRTKENIARVRKDEAEAAEKERQEKLRIENADREARLNLLKQKSRQHLLQCGATDKAVEDKLDQGEVSHKEHVNLFADVEHAVHTTNKDHDKEIKEKLEEYEKKIGYLTYLGQDTNEALKKKNWYEVLPEARSSMSKQVRETYDMLVLRDQDGKPKQKELDEKYGEVGWKAKQRLDPINNFKKICKLEGEIKNDKKKVSAIYSCSKTNQMNKKHKKDLNDEKETKLQKLREARLKREQQEKHKTELFLSGLAGKTESDYIDPPVSKVKPKYNSQFNPELARQNYNR
ncbi:leukocyte receptor cluster member 1 homolog [Amyelois transitella]|uniref:leukocyte receptor cluster member 1 homolog n=1 Tax=Amyelois transitella TaxID=680683 RepID=UPI0029906D02|nr:leukocyte receptor cluster member 1 homolog [Amyelois transitella]